MRKLNASGLQAVASFVQSGLATKPKTLFLGGKTFDVTYIKPLKGLSCEEKNRQRPVQLLSQLNSVWTVMQKWIRNLFEVQMGILGTLQGSSESKGLASFDFLHNNKSMS